MLPSLCIFSFAQSVQLIKNAAFCSHQGSRLCVALLSHGEDQTKTSYLIFWPHVRERVEKGVMMSVKWVGLLLPQALDPSHWDAGNIQSNSSVERPQWFNNSWITVVSRHTGCGQPAHWSWSIMWRDRLCNDEKVALVVQTIRCMIILPFEIVNRHAKLRLAASCLLSRCLAV